MIILKKNKEYFHSIAPAGVATEEELPLMQHMDAGTRRGREERRKRGGKGGRGGVGNMKVFFYYFLTYIFLVHADHDSWMFWASNNGREHGSGSIITGETGLAHTGTIVDHEGLHFFIVIAHIVLVFWSFLKDLFVDCQKSGSVGNKIFCSGNLAGKTGNEIWCPHFSPILNKPRTLY